jgi:hypothetical protein
MDDAQSNTEGCRGSHVHPYRNWCVPLSDETTAWADWVLASALVLPCLVVFLHSDIQQARLVFPPLSV